MQGGKELGVQLYRLLIVVVISWLIFEKSQRASSYPEDDFTLLFPEAVRIENDEIFNQEGQSLGYFLTTSPECDHLKGYSGPTSLALALDKTGRLIESRIIKSSDTPDHVQSVVDDSNFWRAHLGLSIGSPGNPKIDAVTGSTLTSAAISRSIIERLGGLTTSRLFPTEILAAELPEADSIKKHPNWPGVLCMYDEGRKIVGYALRTAPSQEYLHGYQGPTDILIVLDHKAKKVGRIRLRKSYDNEEYFERILDNPNWLNLYNGMTIEEILVIDQSKVEGISGATHTSWAIADGVARRLSVRIDLRVNLVYCLLRKRFVHACSLIVLTSTVSVKVGVKGYHVLSLGTLPWDLDDSRRQFRLRCRRRAPLKCTRVNTKGSMLEARY